MLESFPIALLVATFLGALAGLGVGGGSLLILWLTAILEFPYPQARIINLLFFLPTAAVATFLRRKRKSEKISTLPAIIAGSVLAVVFYYLGTQIDVSLLRKGFGGILLFTAIRELLYRKKP